MALSGRIAMPPQQDQATSIAEPPPQTRQIAQALAQYGVLAPRRGAAIRLRLHVDQPARTSLRVALLLDRPGHDLSPGAGRQKFFSERLAESGHVAHRLGQTLVQLPVLILERLQRAGVGDLHRAVLRPPRLEGRVADPVLSAAVPDRDPRLVLLQDPDDLLLAEPALAHRPSPLDGS
jgi:hypothetical protein